MIIYSFILFILITLIFILLLFNISYREGMNVNKKKYKDDFNKKMMSDPKIKEIMGQRNANNINKSPDSFLTKKPSQKLADLNNEIKEKMLKR